ncbi:MAG: GNAT family N-acetyltransferase [Candidatus Brocadiia bacterium]
MTQASRTMDIELITAEDAWHALEPQWDPLVERSASASVFLTLEWLRPWWRHFRGPGDELCVLAARDGDALVGLAPLYRGRAAACGLGSLRRVGFVGDSSGDSEYLDFVAEPGREAEVLAAFFDRLDQEGWDLADLRLLPHGSPHLERLEGLAAERGWLAARDDVPCSSAPLPGDWESYLKGLQSRFRSKLRSLLRRLPAEHGAVFERCTEEAELGARLESLFELHQRRWRGEGKPGAFASEARRRFYYDLARELLRRGWLRFYSLRLGDRHVAHEFSFQHLGRVYYLQQGFDAACGKLSVGTALKAYVVKDSIERGASEYDFLGGIARHKEKWGARPRWCAHLALARPGLRTRWSLWLPRFARRLRDRGRALTPRPLLRLKRGLQERLRQRRARRWTEENETQE